MSFDYYRILKVSKNASMEQIKSSYRKLAMQYHPDMCESGKKEAENVFKALSQAYQVLGNLEAKKAYDKSIGNFGTDSRQRDATRGRWNPAYSVRPANQKAGPRAPITRDMFDVEMWHACHYGDGLENKDAQEDLKQAGSWTDEPDNKHQQYYKRKYAREQREKETGVKWSAESAYKAEDFGRPAAPSSAASSHSRSSSETNDTQGERTNDSNFSSPKKKEPERPRTRYEPTFKTRTGADVMSKAEFFKHEQHFVSAVSNLEKNRQNRQDRQEKEKNTTANTRTPVYGGDFVANTKKADEGSCVIT